MKYIFFIILGILLYKILNNSDKFCISGKDIGDGCSEFDDCDEEFDNILFELGTCQNQCTCILDERLGEYYCRLDEPLFNAPAVDEPLFELPRPAELFSSDDDSSDDEPLFAGGAGAGAGGAGAGAGDLCAPQDPALRMPVQTTEDRSDRKVYEIIQNMSRAPGSTTINFRPSNFDTMQCSDPLAKCIKYTLDNPSKAHIYLARKFYNSIINLFKNKSINDLTFRESDATRIPQNKNSNTGLDLFSGSTCLSHIDFGESATYYFFCWKTKSATDKAIAATTRTLKYIRDNIDSKYHAIFADLPDHVLDVLDTRILITLNPKDQESLSRLGLSTKKYGREPSELFLLDLKYSNQDLTVRLTNGITATEPARNQVRVLYKNESFDSVIFPTPQQIFVLNWLNEQHLLLFPGEDIYALGDTPVIDESLSDIESDVVTCISHTCPQNHINHGESVVCPETGCTNEICCERDEPLFEAPAPAPDCSTFTRQDCDDYCIWDSVNEVCIDH